MNYRLSVLTHGRGELLQRALDAFRAHVTPEPVEVAIHLDAEPQLGFCGATAKLWADSAASGVDYVFHLEHDFEVIRYVDLTEVAAALDSDTTLSQVSLMRDAANWQERNAGGLLRSSSRRHPLGATRLGIRPAGLRDDDEPLSDAALVHGRAPMARSCRVLRG